MKPFIFQLSAESLYETGRKTQAGWHYNRRRRSLGYADSGGLSSQQPPMKKRTAEAVHFIPDDK
ncbi:MAG: hypothetical protein KAJ98_05535, partial [Spirochaetaceae bacterium]|nr:hypothetical protein [Spirochaetaceae bacterium]